MKKIKVLWVTNQVFPEIGQTLNLTKDNTEGWVYGLANNLKNKDEIDLHIATAFNTKSTVRLLNDKIHYYILPSKDNNISYNSNLESKWSNLIQEIKPDIIHIHGTEFAHGLALMNACPTEKYVISIQGMVSVCVKYYLADLSFKEILNNLTIRDIIRFDTLWQSKRTYKLRGKYEKEYILKTNNVIGRTDWDYAHIKAINQNVKYHFCNETLRSTFYSNIKWDINDVKKYTIFMSQGSIPLKGLHKVLEALKIVKNYYGNVKLNIAGTDLTKNTTFNEKIRLTGYGKIIIKLIKKYKLEKHINFLGMQNEAEMYNQYLKSNLFICSSSIENSPNSLGEAQIVGTPCIASYVGGNHNLITHGQNGLLYRFEETEILANLIMKIFSNPDFAKNLSKNGIITSEIRHNQLENVNSNFDIYKNIIINENNL